MKTKTRGAREAIALTAAENEELVALDRAMGSRHRMISDLAIERSRIDAKVATLVGLLDSDQARRAARMEEIAVAHGIDTKTETYDLNFSQHPLVFRRTHKS